MSFTRNVRVLSKTDGRLWRAVQEELNHVRKCQKLEMMGGSQFAILPWDSIYKIFLLLPAESLHVASLVCRAWHKLIKSSDFIESHLRQSDNVLIFLQTVRERRAKTFSVEPFSLFSWKGKKSEATYINFLEIQDGKAKVIESTVCGLRNILATCNGLILGTYKHKRGLFVMNPVTKKLISIPLGTTLDFGESYGLVFSRSTRDYKVVHLFNDEFGQTNCEVFSLSKRSWWAVDGPSQGFERFRHDNKPVEVFQSLHWLPDKYSTHSLSMGVDDDTFFTIELPTSEKSVGVNLVEIRGCLAFISRYKGMCEIDIWILSGLHSGEGWEKKHTITTESNKLSKSVVPICPLHFGREIIFKSRRKSSFYTYDLETEEMRLVQLESDNLELGSQPPPDNCELLPHLNSLASWDSHGM